jgi:diguanylate cyclase (GGDEF)-like protein/PAS domain S-box-containing protein
MQDTPAAAPIMYQALRHAFRRLALLLRLAALLAPSTLLAAQGGPTISERAYWIDTLAQADLAQAREQAYQPFTGLLSQGYGSSAIWVRLRIEPTAANPSPSAQAGMGHVLRISPNYLDEITLFDPTFDPTPRRVGDRVVPGHATLPLIDHHFQLADGAVGRDIWLRLVSSSSRMLQLDLMTLEEALHSDRLRHVFVTLYLALLGTALGWALMNWRPKREPLLLLFALKQAVLLLHGLFYFGLTRWWLGDTLSAPFMDRSTSFLVMASMASINAFEHRFLSEYRPKRWLLHLQFSLVWLVFPVMVLLLALGHVSIALQINMWAILLSPALYFALLLSASAWHAPDGDAMPLLPRRTLVAYYCAIAVVTWYPALTAMGLPGGGFLSVYGFFGYGGLASLMMLIILLKRAQRQEEQGRRVQRDLSLAQQQVALQATHNRAQQSLLDELQRANNRLQVLNTAIEQSPTSIIVTDTEGLIQYVNPAFTRESGYGASEVIGRNPSLLKSGLTDPAVYADMWTRLNNGEPWQGEVINRRKNGETYWEASYMAPVRDAQGRITNFVAVKLDITQRKRSDERIAFMAHHDPLTSLPNRALFFDRCDQALAMARRHRTKVALLLIDLDKFKPINDTLGHDIGDLVLLEAAHRMNKAVRETDTIGRIGGDEFSGLLVGIHDARNAMDIAEKIRVALNQPMRIAGRDLSISSSIGVAIFPDHGSHASDLVQHAEQAMYQSKAQGRDRTTLYKPSGTSGPPA